MIIGLGHDLVEISRIAAAIAKNERFIQRILTEAEWAYCQQKGTPAASAAVRFAAKEACSKALGTGIGPIRWLDMEIRCQASGQPELVLSGRAQALAQEMGVTHTAVSLSHTKESASAVVILEGER